MIFVWYVMPLAFINISKKKNTNGWEKHEYEIDYFAFALKMSKKRLLFLMFCPIVNIVIGFGWAFVLIFICTFIGPAILIGIMEFWEFVTKKD